MTTVQGFSLKAFETRFGVRASPEQFERVVAVAVETAAEMGVEVEGETDEHWYTAIEVVGLEG